MPESHYPSRLGVVVPARDEHERLTNCLLSLDIAAQHARLPVEIVVVLDSCTDASETVAGEAAASLGSRLHVISIEAQNVGIARRTGVQRLLTILGPDADWVSTTDADSTVPPDWFVRQLAHRAVGASMVVGTVQVDDWHDRHALRAPWTRAYDAPGHRHVHGANLSFSARGYLRVGGFAAAQTDEDVTLVKAFRSAGEAVVWATDLPVTTSARRDGRAPRGFAGYLDALEERVATLTPPIEAL
jgi:glycosyltransferase involved in cell wall biosynthesis